MMLILMNQTPHVSMGNDLLFTLEYLHGQKKVCDER